MRPTDDPPVIGSGPGAPGALRTTPPIETPPCGSRRCVAPDEERRGTIGRLWVELEPITVSLDKINPGGLYLLEGHLS